MEFPPPKSSSGDLGSIKTMGRKLGIVTRAGLLLGLKGWSKPAMSVHQALHTDTAKVRAEKAHVTSLVAGRESPELITPCKSRPPSFPLGVKLVSLSY